MKYSKLYLWDFDAWLQTMKYNRCTCRKKISCLQVFICVLYLLMVKQYFVTCDVHTDDTTCTLTQRRLSRAKEQNVFPCVSAFYLSRYYYKRSYSMQDELTIDDISSLATISKSHFDSISHSAHVTAVRPSDRINLASFKTHFAASCLPPCIWNQSLPNLYMSSSTSDRQVADFGLTVTLPHSSSIEYFTPEQNFTPQYGAYCTWSSYSEENSEGKKTNKKTCISWRQF